MSNKKVYINFSGATNITGENLAKKLDITGGRELLTEKTKGKVELCIGWGAKVKKDVVIPKGITVLNHPNAIRGNRNKFASLQAMQAKKVLVADFCTAETIEAELKKKKPSMKLPLVARTNFHQGGKGFWTCLTAGQVKTAIVEGAQYFQNYMDIREEYRLHLFRGELLYAQKKVRRDGKEAIEAAFVDQKAEKIAARAAKADKKLDEDTLKYALGLLAKEQEHADMIIRSNSRGWRFSNVKRANVKAPLMEASVAALTAVGLDFGAVDCCIVEDGTKDGAAYIIEINSGPGLQETPFERWSAALEKFIKDTLEGKAIPEVKAQLKKSVAEFTEGFGRLIDATENAEEVKTLKSLWERMAEKNKK